MPKIKHIEFAGQHGEELGSFYQNLFGWEISPRKIKDFDYYDMKVEGEPTAGIRPEPTGNAEVVVYVEVDDLAPAVERAQGLGATVRIPPMKHGDVHFALIQDPEGNPIGLTEKV